MLRERLSLRQGIRIVVACLAALLLSGWLFWRHWNAWLDTPLPVAESLIVELPMGGNLTGLLDDLHQRAVLDHPYWLRWHARFRGIGNRVIAGEYRIDPAVTPRRLLKMVINGEVVEYDVTLIEGNTVREFLQTLDSQPRLGRARHTNDPETLLQELGIESTQGFAEGLFFPDTYRYHHGINDIDILRTAYHRMQDVLQEEWGKRDANLPYVQPYQALIMASLIEKETGLANERSTIAGVFVRRLQRGMMLQTDPSTIYGLGPGFDGNLTRQQLSAPGDYNTYLNKGLPPTPIAAPGRASIVAALHPESGDSLYFVAKGDGAHQFSATLTEHQAAVRKYQLHK